MLTRSVCVGKRVCVHACSSSEFAITFTDIHTHIIHDQSPCKQGSDLLYKFTGNNCTQNMYVTTMGVIIFKNDGIHAGEKHSQIVTKTFTASRHETVLVTLVVFYSTKTTRAPRKAGSHQMQRDPRDMLNLLAKGSLS